MPSKSDLQFAQWLNGETMDKITLADRGLQYGDGFFTTIAILDGKILNWSGHWARIQNSSKVLQFPEPTEAPLLQSIKPATHQFLQANRLKNAVLKIIYTRGEGGQAYAAPDEPNPNIMFYFKLMPNISKDIGFKVGISSTIASTNSFKGVKTLNRLENVMARTEALTNGLQESIMFDCKQNAVCASQCNLFMVKGQKIYTPNIISSGVAGTSRQRLTQILKQHNYAVTETDITLENLMHADELFLTNAVMGVQAVTEFNEKRFLPHKLTPQIAMLWNNWQIENALTIKDE